MDAPDPSKRFVLFQYDAYYPAGAVQEHTGSFPTLEAAKAFLRGQYSHIDGYGNEHMGSHDSYDILDAWTGEWVD